jgi:hypothetical protein
MELAEELDLAKLDGLDDDLDESFLDEGDLPGDDSDLMDGLI